MVWNKTTQQQYKRERTRFEIDMTAAEWELLKLLLPPPSNLGQPRKIDLQESLNDMPFIFGKACRRRVLLECFRRLRRSRTNSEAGGTAGS